MAGPTGASLPACSSNLNAPAPLGCISTTRPASSQFHPCSNNPPTFLATAPVVPRGTPQDTPGALGGDASVATRRWRPSTASSPAEPVSPSSTTPFPYSCSVSLSHALSLRSFLCLPPSVPPLSTRGAKMGSPRRAPPSARSSPLDPLPRLAGPLSKGGLPSRVRCPPR
jgi:hypothetical protein